MPHRAVYKVWCSGPNMLESLKTGTFSGTLGICFPPISGPQGPRDASKKCSRKPATMFEGRTVEHVLMKRSVVLRVDNQLNRWNHHMRT